MIAERARSGQPPPAPRREDRAPDAGRIGAVLDVLRERLGEDGYRHLVGQLAAAYVELAESSS